MRVVSVQVGEAATLEWRSKLVHSAIVKQPVGDRPIPLRSDGLEGDEQADRALHGGPDKAVCCYPAEHVPEWEELVGEHLPPGAFGENLRTEGITERDAHIGDTFELGTALVQVSQPRGPCYKIAARWNSRALPNAMARTARSGFYLRVMRPGEVRAGDTFVLTDRRSGVTVADVMRVTYVDRSDSELTGRVMEVAELAEQWRASLRALLRRNAMVQDVTAE